MNNSFLNPFDLSSYNSGKKYYHWCVIKDEIITIKNIDLLSLEDVKKDILEKRPELGMVKVIRTVEPFKFVLKYFNDIDKDIIIPGDIYDEKSLFFIEHPFLVDVTKEALKLCIGK